MKKIQFITLILLVIFVTTGLHAQTVAMQYLFDGGQDSLVLNLGHLGAAFGKVRNVAGWSDGINSSPFWQATDSIFQYENNQCMRFENENDWVYIGRGDSNNINLPAITVEAWIKPENRADPKHQYIFWGSTDVVRMAFRVTEDLGLQRLMVILYSPDNVAHVMQSLGGSIQPGVWQHVAFTYDEITGARLFINGEMVTTMPTFGELIFPYGPWSISAPNIFSFYGCIDEVRVSDFIRVPGNGDGTGMNLAWNASLRDLLPQAVTLVSPEDEATVDASAGVTLSWTDSDDADYYWLQISRIDDFSELIVDNDELYESPVTLDVFNIDSLYYWRVGTIDDREDLNWSGVRTFTAGGSVAIEDSKEQPAAFRLEQNYPNPFNPVTTIAYTILRDAQVTLVVHNHLGEEVCTLVDRRMNPGYYTSQFNASELPSGTYFYTLKAADFSRTRQLTVVK